MSDASLPEELIRDILELRLCVSPSDFLSFPGHGLARWRHPPRRNADHIPASTLLLVSKRWLRIGTPLLYTCVHIWKSQHSSAIAKLLKSNPELGRAIRCLRLEGGMGKDLYTIVEHAPNIESLYVSLHFRPSQGIAGLRKALPLLNPTKLYLHIITPDSPTTAFAGAHELIERAIAEVWTSLTSIHFYHYYIMNTSMANALRKAPVLKQLCVNSIGYVDLWIGHGHVAAIAANPALRGIRCFGTAAQSVVEDAIAKAALPERAARLFSFVDVDGGRSMRMNR